MQRSFLVTKLGQQFAFICMYITIPKFSDSFVIILYKYDLRLSEFGMSGFANFGKFSFFSCLARRYRPINLTVDSDIKMFFLRNICTECVSCVYVYPCIIMIISNRRCAKSTGTT